MTITKERLAEIKARAEAAFKGPWSYNDFIVECEHTFDDDVDGCLSCRGEGEVDIVRIEAPKAFPNGQVVADVPGLEPLAQKNGEFIAHARADIPDLVAEVERLRKLVREAEWRSYREYPEDQTCPWCDAGAKEGMHRNDCPAFTADGVVK